MQNKQEVNLQYEMSSMQVLETQKKPIQNNISLIQSKINKGNVKKKESS